MQGILTLTSFAQDDGKKTEATRYILNYNVQPYSYLVIQSVAIRHAWNPLW